MIKNYFIFYLSSVILSGEIVLYSGYTESGWQIFQSSLSGLKEPLQLTQLVGDCRRPSYHNSRTYFKDSKGQIRYITLEKKELQTVKYIKNACDYAITPEGVYFTRLLSSSEPSRQPLWFLGHGESEPKLVLRFDKGSIAQLSYAEKTKTLIFTKLILKKEEVIYQLKDGNYDLLTTENEYSFYPHINQDGNKLLFSKRVSKDNLDIFMMDLETSVVTQLTNTEHHSELCAVFSDGEKSIVFERRNMDFGHKLIKLDMKLGEETILDKPHNSVEPWIIPNYEKN